VNPAEELREVVVVELFEEGETAEPFDVHRATQPQLKAIRSPPDGEKTRTFLELPSCLRTDAVSALVPSPSGRSS
jgi:hypothetical protein